VDELLYDASSFGRTSPYAFINISELPSAYYLVGRYKTSNDSISVDCRLITEGKEVDKFTVTGTTSDIKKLASDIISRVQIPESQ